MAVVSASGPLDLRALFATPWEGDGVVVDPWYLRLIPGPRRFRFRSEISDVHGDSWVVVDTITFADGAVQRRTMQARQLDDDLIELTAHDMPGGARVRTRGTGFDFSPYLIRTPVLGQLRVALRYYDSVDLDPTGVLTDTIALRYRGLRVATITIRLRRCC
jgi:hypothetical protein